MSAITPPAPAAGEGSAARLAALLARGRVQARRARRPVLVSLVEAVPALDLLDALQRAAAPDYAAPERTATDRFYWERPDRGVALAGAGAAVTLAPAGARRFETVDRAWRALVAGALVDDEADGAPMTGPLLVGGFAFEPDGPRTERWRGFPAALMLLPRLQLTVVDGRSWLTTNVVVRADGQPDIEASTLRRLRGVLLGERAAPPAPAVPRPVAAGGEETEVPPAAEWERGVDEAVTAIRGGALEKVVLAREVRARAGQRFDVADALRRLGAAYPSCFVYALWRGERAFVGASPERLVRLEQGDVRATCLAGSIGRGATPEADQRQGERLLASAKDRHEHAVVARALRDGLAELCDDVRAPAEPTLLTVSNVHHLHTPLRARLRPGCGLLDLVARLHPTPAVGGAPREAALRFLRAHEALDRGWYAGPIGWLGRDGDGEFAVALRSALVDGREASLFAGCGVMADSDPAEEYAESALKLRAMEAALGLEGRLQAPGSRREGEEGDEVEGAEGTDRAEGAEGSGAGRRAAS
ncbi:MAG TPA: isochorismate synthase [Gemmatimonadaceae bacterium]|nr:isochorismate synthase [Gemmatimonadaceae bacterium]